MLKLVSVISLYFMLSSTIPVAAKESFTTGPVFKEYGENVLIENGLPKASSQRFKVVFDISDQSPAGQANRQFNSVARFINMHVRAGVEKENIDLAMVVHGKASFDLMNDEAHLKKFETANGSTRLIKLLSKFGVKVILCGQSARYHGIEKSDLHQEVQISLSAMTANALLQQQGYTLNPF